MNIVSKAEGRRQKAEVKKSKKAAIFYITHKGRELAKRMQNLFPDAQVLKFTSEGVSLQWGKNKALIFIMATGIVVRTLAPLLKDKKTDPAVVVMDEKGEYVISLLGGHLGGANALAKEIAGHLGSHAVITTASDVQGKTALDLWASEKGLYVEDYVGLKKLSTKIVNGQKVKVRLEVPADEKNLPKEFEIVGPNKKTDMIITNKILNEKALFLRPANLFVGIGCNRGTSKEEIREVFDAILKREKLSIHSVSSLASIDLKRDEQGLIDFAADAGLNIDFFSKDTLNKIAAEYDITSSEAVRAATGAVAVAEPAAVSGAKKTFGHCTIITPKIKRGNVTLAIAEAKFML